MENVYIIIIVLFFALLIIGYLFYKRNKTNKTNISQNQLNISENQSENTETENIENIESIINNQFQNNPIQLQPQKSIKNRLEDDNFLQKRKEMIEYQIKRRGIRNNRVLEALFKVPRHYFVPSNQINFAYEDTPLPIGYGQTISQPYIVAFMTDALNLHENDKVLEIGTGSGYQAAILSQLCKEVYTIEIIRELGEQAKELFKKLGYDNIKVKIGDGYEGWEEYAPFDAIIVTCSPNHVPPPLKKQLKIGGKIIIPIKVNSWDQYLVILEKLEEDKFNKEYILPVRFVPMTGKAEQEN